MRYFSILLAGALAACALAPAFAEHGSSAGDRQFVLQAAKGGTEEVLMGRAQMKSRDPKARQFAARMVKDHSKNNAQLKLIAQENGLSSVFAQGVKEAQAGTGTMPGPQYLSHEVSDHQQDIQDFEKEAASGKSVSIRAFARMTLPVLRTHLQLAQRLSSTP